MFTIPHKTRALRDISRQSRHQPGSAMVLDDANDAWLDSDGRVSTRESGNIGNIGQLRGAARISSACKMVNAHRGHV